MRRPRHYYSKLESGFLWFLLAQWSGPRCCGTLLMISANALGKDLCLGREREDICLPSSLHHCVSCQRLFLTVFQILGVGGNIAELFSSAAQILRPVLPYKCIVMMLRGMWQSITLNHVCHLCICKSYYYMLLDAMGKSILVFFASSLICLQFKYKDFIT